MSTVDDLIALLKKSSDAKVAEQEQKDAERERFKQMLLNTKRTSFQEAVSDVRCRWWHDGQYCIDFNDFHTEFSKFCFAGLCPAPRWGREPQTQTPVCSVQRCLMAVPLGRAMAVKRV